MAILGLAFTQIAALAEPISSGPIVPGEWNSNYRAAYEYAVANHMPFIAIVSKYPEQCHFCSMFHDKWTCDEFLEWAKARGPIMGAFYTNSPDGTDSKWVDWVAGKAGSAGSISGFPMIRVYWDKGNGNIVWDRFMGRQSSIGDADGDKTSGTVKDFIARLERTLDGWNAVTYNGGEFDIGSDVEGDRLEADAGTAQIELKLVRDEKAAQEKSKNTLSVTYPSKSGGLQLSAINAGAGDTEIEWAVGDTNKTVNLAIDTARLNDGDAITLVLKDEDGEGHATNHVWFVEKPVSAVNPYWIGEKADLGFGEWTMDLDAATNLVAKSHGQANTLVLLEGALWCGDCKNVEANFLSVTNAVGENRFEAWAKANNIALVAIEQSRCAHSERGAYRLHLADDVSKIALQEVDFIGHRPCSVNNEGDVGLLGCLRGFGADISVDGCGQMGFDVVLYGSGVPRANHRVTLHDYSVHADLKICGVDSLFLIKSCPAFSKTVVVGNGRPQDCVITQQLHADTC